MDTVFEKIRPWTSLQYPLIKTSSASTDSVFSHETLSAERVQPLLAATTGASSLIRDYLFIVSGIALMLTVARLPALLRDTWFSIVYSLKRLNKSPAQSLLPEFNVLEGEKSRTGNSQLARLGPPRPCPLSKIRPREQDNDKGLKVRATQPRGLQFVRCYLRSILLYQPSRTLGLQLPSNGSIVVLASLVGLNAYFLLSGVMISAAGLNMMAEQARLLFFANLPVLYLSGSKSRPLALLTGLSPEFLILALNRLLEIMLICASLSDIKLLLDIPIGPCLSDGLVQPTSAKTDMILMPYLIIFSLMRLGYFRNLYGVYLGVSMLLELAALSSLLFCTSNDLIAQILIWISLVIYALDRAIYRCLFTNKLDVSISLLEDQQTLQFSGRDARTSTLLSRASPEPIQITTPETKKMSEANWISCSVSNSLHRTSFAQFNLIVRRGKTDTTQWLQRSFEKQALTVRVSVCPKLYQQSKLKCTDLAILVAGGTGISAAWRAAQQLLNIQSTFDSQIDARIPRKPVVVLIWVIRSSAHLCWVGRQALADLEYTGAIINIPRATDEIGRPDLPSIINNYVCDFASASNSRIGVMAAGSDNLCRTVRNTAAAMVRMGKDVALEIENHC